jgi:hypothetical protein
MKGGAGRRGHATDEDELVRDGVSLTKLNVARREGSVGDDYVLAVMGARLRWQGPKRTCNHGGRWSLMAWRKRSEEMCLVAAKQRRLLWRSREDEVECGTTVEEDPG